MTSKRWQIFQDNESLGTMTAEEIRIALRDGRLDPFDCVLDEVDGVKRELVEVTEIFDNPSVGGENYLLAEPRQSQEEKSDSELGVLGESRAVSTHGNDDPSGDLDSLASPERTGRQFYDDSSEPSSTLKLATSVADLAYPKEGAGIEDETQITDKPDIFKDSAVFSANPLKGSRAGLSGAGTNVTAATRQVKRENDGEQQASQATAASMSRAWSHEGETGKHRFANAGESKLNRRKTKRFQLIDSKGRILGPLSANEVQALYQRKLAGKNIRVKKLGEDKTITIDQFISAYAGERIRNIAAGNLAEAHENVLGKQPSRVMHELHQLVVSRRLAKMRRFAKFRLLVGSFLAGVALYSLADFIGFPNGSQRKLGQDAARIRQQVLVQARDPGLKDGSRPSQLRAGRERSVQSVVPRNGSAQPSSTNRSRPSNLAVSKTSVPSARISSVVKLRVLAKNRSTVMIGPLRFSPRDLASCKKRCELIMRDRAGQQLTAIFEKKMFADRLLVDPRSVTILGEVFLRGQKIFVTVNSIP